MSLWLERFFRVGVRIGKEGCEEYPPNSNSFAETGTEADPPSSPANTEPLGVTPRTACREIDPRFSVVLRNICLMARWRVR